MQEIGVTQAVLINKNIQREFFSLSLCIFYVSIVPKTHNSFGIITSEVGKYDDWFKRITMIFKKSKIIFKNGATAFLPK